MKKAWIFFPLTHYRTVLTYIVLFEGKNVFDLIEECLLRSNLRKNWIKEIIVEVVLT